MVQKFSANRDVHTDTTYWGSFQKEAQISEMSWECRRERAYRYDRDVEALACRKSGPVCLVVTHSP